MSTEWLVMATITCGIYFGSEETKPKSVIVSLVTILSFFAAWPLFLGIMIGEGYKKIITLLENPNG